MSKNTTEQLWPPMIRDPSDGSVKEGLTCNGCGEAFFPDHSQEREPTTGLCWLCFHKATTSPVIDPTTSGLQTGSEKPENMARLEKSREWLKNYLHRKTEGTSK